MYYPLKAKCIYNNEFIEFTLNDCPKLIDDNNFILSKKPMSPILNYSSIRRGSDIFSCNGKRIYEGDILETIPLKVRIKIIYNKGFVCNINNQLIDLIQIGLSNFIEEDINYKNITKNLKYKVICKNKTIYFNISNIVGHLNNSLILNLHNHQIVKLSQINQFTQYKNPFDSKDIYFGDIISIREKRNGEVILHNGNLSINLDGNLKQLKDISCFANSLNGDEI